MNLTVNSKVEIPASEIQWRFSRSSGAGGQNVNKTDSRVEIVFNVSESRTLTPYQKHRISIQDEVKLSNGCICIAVQDKRRETTPTRSSKRKRVESKKKRGELKKSRQSKIDY